MIDKKLRIKIDSLAKQIMQMKEMFSPEKCPHCKADTVVMHYNRGYRVECPNNTKGCNWYGVFHFDNQSKGSPDAPPPSEAIKP